MLSAKTMNATLDRYDVVVPLASLMGTLVLILSVCDSTTYLLTSALAWPIWFGLPKSLSLGTATFVGVGSGVAFYYT